MSRRPLGRGLDALIPSSAAETDSAAEERAAALERRGGGGFLLVALERIRAGRFQPRRQFDQGRLEELAVASEAAPTAV